MSEDNETLAQLMARLGLDKKLGLDGAEEIEHLIIQTIAASTVAASNKEATLAFMDKFTAAIDAEPHKFQLADLTMVAVAFAGTVAGLAPDPVTHIKVIIDMLQRTSRRLLEASDGKTN